MHHQLTVDSVLPQMQTDFYAHTAVSDTAVLISLLFFSQLFSGLAITAIHAVVIYV